ncbi:MAG TPA: hypothetical protein VMD48_00535 [Solirubrobacteraceae bacterium]|nr:hypothetical protein [Solirubrobacteraceae bacterium]
MTPEPPPTPPNVDIPEDVPRVYTNFVLIKPGAMDLTIAMGHQVATNPPEWSVQATMSWEEAKFLIGALQTSINAHEQTFGEVRDIARVAQEVLARAVAQNAENSEEEEDRGEAS